ncbi:hypothetical protein M5X11_16095 [Paenibacillus alginolyticus]|uniref:hypothetical protein n=1 Tax=Paenibacillus alginolyticus TaxID=59839 RepID=UPI00040B3759|nr:hypothetical protein [Paenibacillus alginolyticus]MCY9666466.1 hypothetical protein [Paenibacillus alginolyticus]
MIVEQEWHKFLVHDEDTHMLHRHFCCTVLMMFDKLLFGTRPKWWEKAAINKGEHHLSCQIF